MARIIAIHGVSNRSEDGFRHVVDGLAKLAGLATADFADVFWGDLGPEGPLRSIPSVADAAIVVPTAAGAFRQADVTVQIDANDPRVSAVVDATVDKVATTATGPATVSGETEQALRDAVRDAAASGSTAALLPEVAPLLADVILAAPPAGSAEVDEAAVGAFHLPSVKDLLGSVLGHADAIIGSWITREFRSHEAGLGEMLAHNVGDVLVYHSAGPAIRGRFDTAFRSVRAASDGPIDVVAHSLGTLVTVEWLLGANTAPEDGSTTPLAERRIRHLVTMGTQVSLFAELEGLVDGTFSVTADAPDPLPLPIAVDSWTNVWHGLDPLAFEMHRVLSVSSQAGLIQVSDLCLPQLGIPNDLSFHSSYWSDARFAKLIATTFGG